MAKHKQYLKTQISEPQLKAELIKLFESGNTDKGKCREILGIKYKIQVQRFYKSFNLYIKEWQQIKEKAIAEQVQSNVANGLKSAYLSKIERLDILSKIAKGKYKIKKPFVIGGVIMEYPVEPDHTDIKNAIAEINKMEGDYAAAKTEFTGANGTPLLPTGFKIEM